MFNFIPIYVPYVAKNQEEYVMNCVRDNWISSRGDYLDKFEQALAQYMGVNFVSTVTSGSTALMLMLKALGIGTGDEVITQNVSYIATVNAIIMVGAKPVIVDCNTKDLQINCSRVEGAITERTKAILVAGLYGNFPNLYTLQKIADNANIHFLEDSAECFGCTLDNKYVGSFGKAACFSFFGNKTITCGEGGCITTNDGDLYRQISLLRCHSHIGGYIHTQPGYNFMMTNIQAAIGLAQLEEIEFIINRKKQIADYYRANLDSNYIKSVVPEINSSEWLQLFFLPETISYLKFSNLMQRDKIDTRPAFTPVSKLKGFDVEYKGTLNASESQYSRGFNLPNYPSLTDGEVEYIVETVNKNVKTIS